MSSIRNTAMEALSHILAHGRHDAGQCPVCDAGQAAVYARLTGERFDMPAETFVDRDHGHEWTRAVSGPLNWAQAQEYAAACRAGGHKDWRLPECDELQTLVDHSAHSPATWPELRSVTPSDWFWTSTPWAPSSGYAWFVGFSNGYAGNSAVSSAGRVRCVR